MSKERSGLRIGMACRLTEKQEEEPGAMSKERSGMRIGMACRLREARETAPGAMSKERSGLRISMACRLTERKIYKVALTKECFARYNIVCFNRCIHKG